MADRPPVPASRVGRPRTRSIHQSLHVPAPKVGRPRSKSVYQPKVKLKVDMEIKTPKQQRKRVIN